MRSKGQRRGAGSPPTVRTPAAWLLFASGLTADARSAEAVSCCPPHQPAAWPPLQTPTRMPSVSSGCRPEGEEADGEGGEKGASTGGKGRPGACGLRDPLKMRDP